jgi:dolichol kinase
MAGNLRRAGVHVLVGLSIAILTYLLPHQTMLVLLGAGTGALVVLDLVRLRSPRVHAWAAKALKPLLRDYEQSRLLGATFLLVACLAVVTLFSKPVAVLAVTYVAVGDPLAGLVGEKGGRRRLFKTHLVSALVCLASCIVAAVVWHYAGLDILLSVALLGATAAAMAESVSTRIDDNLSIPLISGAVMWALGFVLR